MINSVNLEVQKIPLYDNEDEALNAPGRVFRHFKGGIYRIICENVISADTLERLVLYEHLWPHTHQIYVRGVSEFFDAVVRSNYRGPRFKEISK